MRMTYDFIIVGAGGTGGHLITFLARQIASLREEHSLTICDGDRIERKNITRQPFFEHEIGENKATNIAKKINVLYPGIEVSAFSQFIDTKEQLLALLSINNGIPVLIGAVDNHQARIVMEEVFSKLETIIYIDSANEKYSGEVVIGVKNDGKILKQPRSFYDPDIMKDDGIRRSEQGCQSQLANGTQRLTANLMAATIVFTYCSKLLFSEQVENNMVVFDTIEMGVTKSYGRYNTIINEKTTFITKDSF